MKTVVIGGGPAGLISAYFSASGGNETVLIEKNEKLGKKLYISGKGRCNVTNNCNNDEFLNNVVTNPKFLMSSINRFSPHDFMEFLSKKVMLKTERGNRVYPISDKASDITKCFESYLYEVGVSVKLNERVIEIVQNNGMVCGVKTDTEFIYCDNVIVCTGGISYPLTGSTGDGYKFAKLLGHTVVEPKSALCGINLKDGFYKALQGVSLKNVRITAKSNGKTIFSDFGEMLFTHFGISGPIVLSMSSYINKLNLNDITIYIDLKPALSEEQLDLRILRDFEKYKNNLLKNSLDDLLLKGLIPIVLEKSGVNGEIKNSELKTNDRKLLVNTIKNLEMKPVSLRAIDEAIVTSGGISVKEINPKTMESKIVKGLYFAGEVIDVDALTGGFNITIASATGFVAGSSSCGEHL